MLGRLPDDGIVGGGAHAFAHRQHSSRHFYAASEKPLVDHLTAVITSFLALCFGASPSES
jgi:hypothetical protein